MKLNEINREHEHKESLIRKAKAEYTKKTMPPESKAASGDGMSHIFFATTILRCEICSLEYVSG